MEQAYVHCGQHTPWRLVQRRCSVFNTVEGQNEWPQSHLLKWTDGSSWRDGPGVKVQPLGALGRPPLSMCKGGGGGGASCSVAP